MQPTYEELAQQLKKAVIEIRALREENRLLKEQTKELDESLAPTLQIVQSPFPRSFSCSKKKTTWSQTRGAKGSFRAFTSNVTLRSSIRIA
jgi:hypothetical protein